VPAPDAGPPTDWIERIITEPVAPVPAPRLTFNAPDDIPVQRHADEPFQRALNYHEGRGVPQDDAQAFQWFAKAAHQGHADAQFRLSAMYLSGRGVQRDLEQTRFWLQKAVRQGHPDARTILGIMLGGTTESVTDREDSL